MKPKTEVMARARGLVEVELFRRLREASKRLPSKCAHNHRHPLDLRPQVQGDQNPFFNRIDETGRQTIGLCMLGASNPEEWSGNICEDAIDAQRCPFFTPLQDKAAIVREFKDQLSDPTWVAEHMPQLGALLWALGIDRPPKLSFWARVKAYFTGIKIEPVKPSLDPVLILSKPDETDPS